MKSSRRSILAALALVLISSPVLAQPGELLRKLRQAFRERLLPDVTAEEREALKAIRGEFLVEARPTLDALRAEVRAFVGSLKEILSDEQEAKTRELLGRFRDLPLPKKMALLRRLLGSLRGEEMARDAGLFLGGSAEEKVQAGERIARRAAKAMTSFLAKKGAIGESEGEATAKAIDGFLERTRPRREELRKLAEAKLLKAWSTLTDGQRSRLEAAKGLALAWLAGSPSR